MVVTRLRLHSSRTALTVDNTFLEFHKFILNASTTASHAVRSIVFPWD